MKKLIFILALLFPLRVYAACEFNAISTLAERLDGGTLTLNAPASPSSGDIWVAVVASANGDGGSFGFTDWTVIANSATGFGNLGWSAWWFRYAGSTPNLDVTGATDDVGGVILQLRGCLASGDVVDSVGTQTNTANSDTVTIVGFTPSTSNTLLISVVAFSDDSTGVSSGPSGFDERADTNITGGLTHLAVHTKAHVSGATGNFSLTMTTNGGDDEISSRLFAIKQAVAAGGRRQLLPVLMP